ncbi:MAG: hypothetical protein QOG13_614 [Sphingomonadales bacterium]|jgi:TonB family protein|nr:hypothetical protein [Sphingomonadales bacterium]
MIAAKLLALVASATIQSGAVGDGPSRAQANLAQYLSDADYPPEAIRNGEHGIVGIRLEVGADGVVTACRVTAPSGSPSLDAASCRVMTERARFTPARNAAGQAVADSVASRIRWVLPDPVAPPVRTANLASYLSDLDYPVEAIRAGVQGRVTFILEVSPTGIVTDCHIVSSSGSDLLDRTTCRLMTERPRFAPARDAAGNATTDYVTSTVVWRLPG